MPRELTANRWNWDDNLGQWVFIEITEKGKRKYHYKLNPPEEFITLTTKLKELNEKLIITKDPDENLNIFNEMVKISKKLQFMPRS